MSSKKKGKKKNNNNHEDCPTNNKVYGIRSQQQIDNTNCGNASVIINLPIDLDSVRKDDVPSIEQKYTTYDTVYRAIFNEPKPINAGTSYSSAISINNNNSESSQQFKRCEHIECSQESMTMCELCADKFNLQHERNLENLQHLRDKMIEHTRKEYEKHVEESKKQLKEKIIEEKLPSDMELPSYDPLDNDIIPISNNNNILAFNQSANENDNNNNNNHHIYKKLLNPLNSDGITLLSSGNALGIFSEGMNDEEIDMLMVDPKKLDHQELLYYYNKIQQFCKARLQQVLVELVKHNNNVNNVHMETKSIKDKIKQYQPYRPSIEEQVNKNSKSYEILSDFTTRDQWPTSTDVFCWWDGHPFDTTPIPLPIKYRSRDNKFLVKGCFCSFNCVISYNKYYERNSVDNSLINFFYRRFTGDKKYKHIFPALEREALQIFGGPFTIEEFRQKSCDKTLTYEVVSPPATLIQMQLIETRTHKTRSAASKKPRKKQRKKTTNDEELETILREHQQQQEQQEQQKKSRGRPKKLRLARNKPLPNAQNTLFASMGIKIK